MAETMGAEAAVVRVQLVSGTHAIATALYTCLRPGDRLLAVAGRWAAELPLPQCLTCNARMTRNGRNKSHGCRSFLPHGSSLKTTSRDEVHWALSRRKTTVVCRRPYDTLEEVIGLRGTPGHGSLAEWGVSYAELPRPMSGGAIDWAALPAALTPGVQPRQAMSSGYCCCSLLLHDLR